MLGIIFGIFTILGTILAIISYFQSKKKNKSLNKSINKENETTLADYPNAKIIRTKENTPEYLLLLATPNDVLNIIENSQTLQFSNDKLNENESELVGNIFDKLRDWGDLHMDLNPSDRINFELEVANDLELLKKSGLYIFGAKEKQILKVNNRNEDWIMSIIRVCHGDNDEIIKINAF